MNELEIKGLAWFLEWKKRFKIATGWEMPEGLDYDMYAKYSKIVQKNNDEDFNAAFNEAMSLVKNELLAKQKELKGKNGNEPKVH